jgi:hypothetical protein
MSIHPYFLLKIEWKSNINKNGGFHKKNQPFF